jgi:uncharacterized membrane protein
MTQRYIKARKFDKAGFYFIGLLIIAFLGFWKTYFSRFFYGSNDYSFYFHFHAAMMLTWTAILIIQPILIRKKKLQIHRLIGKLSYFIMPLLLISVLFILNITLKRIPVNEIRFADILSPFRDLLFLSIFYTVAVIYKHRIQIHARAMIATGIVFIEPSLGRFLGGQVFQSILGAYIAWGIILAVLITLVVFDWKQKSGRWIFRSMLVVFILSYSITLSGAQFPLLDSGVKWFGKLPLTSEPV